jgi:hypothetical protein
MTQDTLSRWLDSLGYASAEASLHRTGQRVPEDHPYAVEIDALLSPHGEIQAQAVFDVEGVPTVCFLGDEDGDLLAQSLRLDAIRRRIWNQNLISIVLVVQQNRLHPMPVGLKGEPSRPLVLSQASASGPFSAADIQSGDVRARHVDWFKPESRVDHHLLRNLGDAVRAMEDEGLDQTTAQIVLGQVLFVSYLEHRGIVSDTYRKARRVRRLPDLIREQDRAGLHRLLAQLRSDFNGDFLKPDDDEVQPWSAIETPIFDCLAAFLDRVDLSSGQTSLWTYDFSYIPVELISGIYETFLADSQRRIGAFYTPRHLANLVIDQAFSASSDPLAEVIYDGACGSGILLTTAFRRLLHLAEKRQRRALTLAERIKLLTSRIFGSDLSKAACRVSAFSLYLSLLERLEPADIVLLQNDENVKLPPLLKTNLRGGTDGDFFSPANKFVKDRIATIFLCNPPWVEPDGDEALTSDTWAEAEGYPRTRRQLAGDFAQRAIDALADGGHFCLILPASLLLAATSTEFVQSWLLRARLSRIINFSDQRELVFKSASHACIVVLGTPRRDVTTRGIPINETVEYWCPKADVSLLFGRLTLNSGDRHEVQTQALLDSPQQLVTLMWGNAFDLALHARLRLLGTFGELFAGAKPRWRKRKGFHHIDRHAEPVSSRPLHKYGFLSVEALHGPLPVLDDSLVGAFPARAMPTVASRLTRELYRVFEGPRILFPDGPSPDLEIRAVFTKTRSSFKNSIGAIVGPPEDEDLLRFTTIYLRSDLVSYFLLTQAYQVLSERHRVTLRDVAGFPFVVPDQHPRPVVARGIVAKVAAFTRELEAADALDQEHLFQRKRPQLQSWIYQYFGLTDREADLVREAVADLLPSVQPRGFASLYTPLQHRADTAQLARYARRLQSELVEWRDALGGKGQFEVSVATDPKGQAGPLGIVRVRVMPDDVEEPKTEVEEFEGAVQALLAHLRDEELLPMRLGSNLYFAADTIIRGETSVYLVKPRIRRVWLERSAWRDADRLIDAVRAVEEPIKEQVA